jgi:hypothetical protein
MFEPFQDVAVRSIAFHLCVSRRRRLQRCVFLSRDVREYGCNCAPAERVLVPCRGERARSFAPYADERNFVQRLLAKYGKFVVPLHSAHESLEYDVNPYDAVS